MRALIKLFFLLILLTLAAVAGVFWFVFSDTPQITGQTVLAHQDIARARQILRQNDPRNMPPGATHVMEIGARDLGLASNYLLQQLALGSAQLSLATDRLDLQASLRIPRVPWRNTLNLEASIETIDGQARIAQLRLGRLNVPPRLANLAAAKILQHGYTRARLGNLADPVQELRLFPDRLRLSYRWHPALIDQARDTLLSGSDREALRHYHDLLVDLQTKGVGKHGPLTKLLQPMFAAALARSAERDPVEENNALLTVLGTWAGKQDISRLVPGSPRRPGAFRLKLQRRTDFGRHFLISAALAARGDTALSNAVGLFKEISDTDSGSGFSFADIAADRAGTRFGEQATRSREAAKQVQRRLAMGIVEADIMPPARDLPEHIRSETFKQRFGYVGSPAYQEVMDEIERRINACGLYRN
jgi:hypothetical protein